MDEQPCDVAVVGGGLAGLAAAVAATGGGARVVVLDAHPLGGRARTDERGGFTFNRGPRALYLGGAGAALLGGLGIVPTGGKPPLKGARGVVDGRLGLLPGGPWSLLRTDLLRPRSKAAVGRYLARLPRLHPERFAGQTVAGWLASTGLPDDAADLVLMLVRVATYTNDPGRLSAEVAVGQVQLALGQGVRYLDGGFQQIVDRLADAARRRGADLRRGQAVRSITGEAGAFHVQLADGTEVRARAVVVAAGTPEAAAGLTHPDGAPPASWARLGPPVAAACLELGLTRPAPTSTLFGVDQPLYLNHHAPPAQGLAPTGAAMVHVLRYQERDHRATADQDREELRAHARRAGITDELIVEERFLRRMVVMGGYPLAEHGGLRSRPPAAVEGRPGLFVAGDWVGPTGLLADAALASGTDAGRAGATTPRPSPEATSAA